MIIAFIKIHRQFKCFVLKNKVCDKSIVSAAKIKEAYSKGSNSFSILSPTTLFLSSTAERASIK